MKNRKPLKKSFSHKVCHGSRKFDLVLHVDDWVNGVCLIDDASIGHVVFKQDIGRQGRTGKAVEKNSSNDSSLKVSSIDIGIVYTMNVEFV